MISSPFLTDLDTRAQIKGSRDPLGIQPIWVRFGRHIVGNLTTVSTSVRDFTTTMLGYYFAERVNAERNGSSSLETFIKWEQLAVYSRAFVNKDLAFRGTERVQARLAGDSRVTLSADTRHQILADQKIYGLWGLYSVPSRASGLLESDPTRLTPPSRELVDTIYLPMLSSAGIRNGDQIVALLAEKAPRIDLDGKHKKLVAAIAKVLQLKLLAAERDFYRDHLLYGGPGDATKGLQRRLAGLIEAANKRTAFVLSPAAVKALSKEAAREGMEGERLAEKLDRIAIAESVLAPASLLFGYLLGCADSPIEKIIKHIREVWGPGLRTIDVDAVQKVSKELGGDDREAATRWLTIAQSLASGDYAVLIDHVLEQNRSVMAARGGSPWIMKAGKKLDIRFRDDDVQLTGRSELSSLWRFPYFIESLRDIAVALQGRAA
jgi:hypothetical protein